MKLKKINKIYKTNDVIHKICPTCGKDFITFGKKQKYCNEECRLNLSFKRIPGLPPNRQQEYDISKEAIFRRDGYKCIYCGLSSIEDGVKLHLEHIYPVSKGGKEDLFNLATSCERCNTKKNALILSEDLILRIWERNQKLNEKFIPKEYRELAEIFKKDIEQRLRR